MRRIALMAALSTRSASALAPPPEITLDAARNCAAQMPAATPRIIMGSKSASRRALLEAMGGAGFETRVADVDEDAIGDRAGDPGARARHRRGQGDALPSGTSRPRATTAAPLGCQVVRQGGWEKPVDLTRRGASPGDSSSLQYEGAITTISARPLSCGDYRVAPASVCGARSSRHRGAGRVETQATVSWARRSSRHPGVGAAPWAACRRAHGRHRRAHVRGRPELRRVPPDARHDNIASGENLPLRCSHAKSG